MQVKLIVLAVLILTTIKCAVYNQKVIENQFIRKTSKVADEYIYNISQYENIPIDLYIYAQILGNTVLSKPVPYEISQATVDKSQQELIKKEQISSTKTKNGIYNNYGIYPLKIGKQLVCIKFPDQEIMAIVEFNVKFPILKPNIANELLVAGSKADTSKISYQYIRIELGEYILDQFDIDYQLNLDSMDSNSPLDIEVGLGVNRLDDKQTLVQFLGNVDLFSKLVRLKGTQNIISLNIKRDFKSASILNEKGTLKYLFVKIMFLENSYKQNQKMKFGYTFQKKNEDSSSDHLRILMIVIGCIIFLCIITICFNKVQNKRIKDHNKQIIQEYKSEDDFNSKNHMINNENYPIRSSLGNDKSQLVNQKKQSNFLNSDSSK